MSPSPLCHRVCLCLLAAGWFACSGPATKPVQPAPPPPATTTPPTTQAPTDKPPTAPPPPTTTPPPPTTTPPPPSTTTAPATQPSANAPLGEADCIALMEHLTRVSLDDAIRKGSLTPDQIEKMEKSMASMTGSLIKSCKQSRGMFTRKRFDCMMAAQSIRDFTQCR